MVPKKESGKRTKKEKKFKDLHGSYITQHEPVRQVFFFYRQLRTAQ